MLFDVSIRNAKPREKPYKLVDGGGLYLQVRPNGAKLWRLRYRLAGKENLFAIGKYPAIGLDDARDQRDAAKKLIRKGIHPSHQRKLERIRQAYEHANTFKAVAREWLDDNVGYWTAKALQQRTHVLERDVFPGIGALPVRQITSQQVLHILKRINRRAPAMAMLARQAIGAVCRYAVATLRADSDPTQPLRGSFKPKPVRHRKPLSRDEIPGFIRALEAYPGYFSNKTALHLMLLTFVRTTEVIGARWDELDLEAALWRIPAERMKMREAHTVPLPRQAIELLSSLKAVTGGSEYLFPNRSNVRKPASPGVLWKAVSRMGYTGRFSPHGIRATASTVLNDGISP
jgi:integrase